MNRENRKSGGCGKGDWDRSDYSGWSSFGFWTGAIGKSGNTGLVGFTFTGVSDACLTADGRVKRRTDDFRRLDHKGCLGGNGDRFGGFTTDFSLGFGKDDNAGHQNGDHDQDGENYPECFFAV